MFINYLKLAFRNLAKYKGYTFINIVGLAVGIASVILILLWVQDELSYDKFHKNSDDIYRIVIENHSSGQATRSAKTPNALGAEMLSRFPEVVNFARFFGGYSGWLISYGEKSFTYDRWAAVDPAFFEIFSFTFTSGDPKTALKDQSSIVITEEMAKKYFGEEPALGKIIKREDTDLKVTGVIKVPCHSHLQFDYAVPIVNMKNWWYQDLDSWAPGPFKTYVQLAPHTAKKQFDAKIAAIMQERDPNSKA
jgi:putative ABC transport system permease protein